MKEGTLVTRALAFCTLSTTKRPADNFLILKIVQTNNAINMPENPVTTYRIMISLVGQSSFNLICPSNKGSAIVWKVVVSCFAVSAIFSKLRWDFVSAARTLTFYAHKS